MAQKPFGTRGTVQKLRTVADYLNFYTVALGGKFTLRYLDAFAGTGEIPLSQEMPLLEGVVDTEAVIAGSARRALQITRPFDEYVLVDFKAKNVAELAALKREYPELAARITIEHLDANDAVERFCKRLGSKDRAVIFLDPFGNQVRWRTIEAVASTNCVDLWYLFPAGLGVARQISKGGAIARETEALLDLLYGTRDWRSELLQVVDRADLFEGTTTTSQKSATADAATRFMIKRMKSVFRGDVLQKWLPLGSKGMHWYSLLFAWSNPSPNAKNLASGVAAGLMSRR